jgi:hypothetical protein
MPDDMDGLRRELEESEALRDRMADLLTSVANALKGDPGPLKVHDWSDLPAVAAETAARAEGREPPTT